MSDFLTKCRQLASYDVKSLLERVRHQRFSRAFILSILESLSELLTWMGLFLGLYALILWLWPSAPFGPTSALKTESYSFAQAATLKTRTLSSFEVQGFEGKDPLWLELHAQLDFITANPRVDTPGGLGVAKFRWLATGQELKLEVGQSAYFTLNSASGLWTRSDKARLANLAIKVTKVSGEATSMRADIEVFHPKASSDKGPISWQSVESFTLTRENPKKQSDVQSLQALTRSGCRWWGPDLFLLHHSGPHSRELAMTQRLEVGPTSKKQVLFVGPGYGIIRPGQEFLSVPVGAATQGQNLWVIDDMSDEKLQISGWNAGGDQSVRLSIAKQQESWQPQAIEAQIQLAGVRGSEHLLVQIDQERWSLKVLDWLLHTSKGWEKIRSAEQVDDYVSGRLNGELLILRDMRQDPESKNWLAHFRIYSPARSRLHDFEMKVSQAGLNLPQEPEGPTLDQIKDPHSLFVPLPQREEELPKWPANEERAWQPPSEISPEKMLEILRSLNEPDEESQEPTPPISEPAAKK